MLSAARGVVRRSTAAALRSTPRPRTAVPRATFHASRVVLAEDDDSAAPAVPIEEETGNDGIIGELFGNPFYAVPIGGLGLMTAVKLDWFILNEETQLLGLWCMFVGTIYHNFGDGIAAFFDDIANGIKNEQLAQEDAIIQAMKVTRDAHARQTEIYEDIKSIFEAQQELMDVVVSSKSQELKHLLRSQIVSRLDTVVAEEERMIVDIKDALVNATTEKVRAAVASDDIKAAALDQAFKAIADPNAPAGEDAVANLYSSAFKEFNDRVQKLSAEPQALSPELQAELLEEMKSVARREGLEDLPLEAPTHISVTNM